MNRKLKVPLIIVATLIILFAGVNVAGALNSSFLDAVEGLPLSDQILIIAKEVDRLRLKDELRDACDLADELYAVPLDYQGPRTQSMPVPWNLNNLEKNYQQWVERTGEDKVKEAIAFYRDRTNKYLVAKAECDRLTKEYQEKYGE